MDNNAYGEAPKIVKALDDAIGNLKVVIDDAPGVILLGKTLIPDKIKDITSNLSFLVSPTFFRNTNASTTSIKAIVPNI